MDPPTRQRGTYLLVLPWGLEAVGGVNRVVISLYERLEASGELQPRVLIPDWSAAGMVEAAAAGGIRTVRMRIRPVFADGSLPVELGKYALRLPGEMRKIAALVRRYDVRVVNCHYVSPHALAWSLASALGVFPGTL
ncbi:MAG: hypothetical protein KGL45_10675, partial [Gammaproteobacteria bacterium]|nr:hypothetical protein [Gammaproteobacteria bacterium]